MEPVALPRKITLAQLDAGQIKTLMNHGGVLHKRNTVTLEVNVHGQHKAINVKLVGELSGEYFIVKFPRIEGQLVNLTQGQFLNAKFFDGVEFVHFQTEVIKAVFTPYPFLVLKRPPSLMQVRKTIRSAPRVSALFEASVYVQGQPMGEGVVTDISLTGCMMIFHSDFPYSGGELSLNINIPHHTFNFPIEVRGTLKRNELKDTSSGQCRLLGVAFQDLNPQAYLVITNYIRGEQLQDDV